jgi:hypothetical protein
MLISKKNVAEMHVIGCQFRPFMMLCVGVIRITGFELCAHIASAINSRVIGVVWGRAASWEGPTSMKSKAAVVPPAGEQF